MPIAAVAQTTGTSLQNPTAVSAQNGVSNPENGYSSNNQFARLNSSNDFVNYGNFGISIPAGSVIAGIEVRVEARNEDDRNLLISLSSNNGSTFTATQALNLTDSDVIYNLGGKFALWGRVWSVSDFANGNFVVRCQATGGDEDVFLDHVQVRVFFASDYVAFLTNTTYEVPAGVTSITADLWGAGGGAASGGNAAGGGGGGAYTLGLLSNVTPGSTIMITVGNGGTAGNNGGFSRVQSGSNTVTANGGQAGSGRTGGAGGAASTVGGIITSSFAGGNGGNARSSNSGNNNEAGGGGGGSAFHFAQGGNGASGGSSGGNSTRGGDGYGDGGDGASADGNPSATAGESFGGGGGGRGEGSSSSQAGANGQVVLSFDCPTYALTSVSASATACVSTGTASITLTGSASSLPVGNYTVTYSRSLPLASNLTATMQVTTAGSGTFSIGGLTTAGNATITVTSLSSSSCTSAITTGNVSNTIAVVAAPVVSAGSNIALCVTDNAVNLGTGVSATNTSGVLWTTNGTGTFLNQTSLTNAVYQPSAGDIAAGSVQLTLTGFGIAPCGNATATKTITFSQPPTASAGGFQTICTNQTATVSGATASNGTILWTENGAGSITAGANTLTPTYTPAAADAGTTVTLTMTVSNAPCLAAVATYAVQVVGAATLSAGSDLATCANSGSVAIGINASASNIQNLTWSTSGDGTFTNPTSINQATYTPGPSDIAAKTVTLTLTGTGFTPCANISDTVVLTINEVPSVQGVTVCQGGSGSLSATALCRLGTALNPTNFAGAGSSTDTGAAWTNPGNIVSSNNSRSTASRDNNGLSQILIASGFNFNIPSNAVILGITALIERSRSGLALGDVRDNSIRLLKNGSGIGAEKATNTPWGTEGIATYGGNNDLWNTSWTAAEINSNTFGLLVRASFSGVFGNLNANIDAIQLRVTYAVPGDVMWYTAASGGTAIGQGTTFNPVGVSGSGLADTNTPGTVTFYAECTTVPGCRSAATFTILPLPEVSFEGVSATYCENELPVIINTNQNSGTFSGQGLTDNGNGYATLANWTGTQQISFTYTDGNGCSNTAFQTITVTPLIAFYADADGDGEGNNAEMLMDCIAPSGYVTDNTDCDDTNPLIKDMFAFYADNDGDGTGAGESVMICATDANNPPAGYSLTATDCDDTDAVKSTMFEFYVDADGDTVGAGNPVMVCAVDSNTPPAGYALTGSDCNDADFASVQQFVFYADNDNDGYGAGAGIQFCAPNQNTPPAGYATVNGDCNDGNPAVSPGVAEVGYNRIDDDCDGLIDEGFPPKIAVLNGNLCNITLNTLNQPLFCNIVGGAGGYRWKVTTMSGPSAGEVQFLDTMLRTMRLSQLTNFAYDTTYKVEVAVYFAGFLQPFTESTCTVTTPVPVAQLSTCNANIFTMNDWVYCNIVPFATGYRFRITDPLNPANVAIVDNLLRNVRMTQITSFEVKFNKTYNVEVAVRNTNGSYLPFGPACSITTPQFPTVSLIDTHCENSEGNAFDVPSMNFQILAASYPGVSKYVFKVTGPGLPLAGVEVVKLLRAFSLSDIPGLIPGEIYNVNVRLVFNDTDPVGPFGKTCSVRVPGQTRMAKQPLTATLYPNPFEDIAQIRLENISAAVVTCKVYDMAGRLLENRNIDREEADSISLGQQYPSGIYNIVIIHDEDIKTLRAIKR